MTAKRQTAPSIQELKARGRIVVSETTCWIWMGSKSSTGYGQVYRGAGGRSLAHRYVYVAVRGPIPPSMTLDHLCRRRSCVNPDHLEVVSVGANVLRGIGRTAINARKIHCAQGHPFDLVNTYLIPGGGRGCRTCRRIRSLRRDKAAGRDYQRAYKVRNRNRVRIRDRAYRLRMAGMGLEPKLA